MAAEPSLVFATVAVALEMFSFSQRQRNTITNFVCEELDEFGHLDSNALEAATSNLHKHQVTIDNAANRDRINAAKMMKLQALRVHVHDRIRCGSVLTDRLVAAMNQDTINRILSDYKESLQKTPSVDDAVSVNIPPLKKN